MRTAILEKIEDEMDWAAYLHAKAEMERGELQFVSFDEAWDQINERN